MLEEGKLQTFAGHPVAYARLTAANLFAFHPEGAEGAIFADTNLVTKIILLIVKLTPQPGATLHAIHARDCAVAGFSQLRGAHPAAATVV